VFFALRDDSISQARGDVLNVLLDIGRILRGTRQCQGAGYDSDSDFCGEGHWQDSFAEESIKVFVDLRT
jgi:hypothetical protein